MESKDPHLAKIMARDAERRRQKAEDERRRTIEDEQLKLQRWSVVWDIVNSLVALAGLVVAIIALFQ